MEKQTFILKVVSVHTEQSEPPNDNNCPGYRIGVNIRLGIISAIAKIFVKFNWRRSFKLLDPLCIFKQLYKAHYIL